MGTGITVDGFTAFGIIRPKVVQLGDIIIEQPTTHLELLAPGESFSMADVLGDVSLDTGYAEALIIFGDRTIKGVGGGVCRGGGAGARVALSDRLARYRRAPRPRRRPRLSRTDRPLAILARDREKVTLSISAERYLPLHGREER
jgi:hypothetical protein